MALLAICLACSTFMFFVLLFRGALAPFTTGRGSNGPKGENRRGSAPVRPFRQGCGVSVHRSEAQSLEGRSARIRRRLCVGRTKEAISLVHLFAEDGDLSRALIDDVQVKQFRVDVEPGFPW